MFVVQTEPTDDAAARLVTKKKMKDKIQFVFS